MSAVIISHITHTSPLYPQVWELREAVLRKPLGRTLKDDDMSRDLVDAIFIAMHNDKVVGCVLLHDAGHATAQLRAMAVYNEWQGKDIGRQLVQAAEEYAVLHGYGAITLHARKVAMGFYQKLDYRITSDEFTEVGIPHYMMEKAIG